MLILLVIAIVGGGVWFGWVLKARFQEMKERAALWQHSSEILRGEKRALLESLNEGVVTVDPEGRVSYANVRAQRMLRLGGQPFLGRSLAEVAGADAPPLWREAENVIRTAVQVGERVRHSLSLGDADKVYLELVAMPNQGGCVLVMQDCSSEHKVLEMGKEFIANASHELRTPVTIIKGFAETLSDLPEISEEMFDSILEKIIRNCERMETLVKSLLTLADLDNSAAAKQEECDLVTLLEHCHHNILHIHPEICIELLHNCDKAPILGDGDLLELAFLNILKNAVKYSPRAAQITVTLDVRDAEIFLSIADEGMGIPPDNLDRVFDRFFTVNKAHSRKLGGAGLGLSIVKIIMEKHGADIWVTSELDKGTTFHMRFRTESHLLTRR